jgi:hypothetical protein
MHIVVNTIESPGILQHIEQSILFTYFKLPDYSIDIINHGEFHKAVHIAYGWHLKYVIPTDGQVSDGLSISQIY